MERLSREFEKAEIDEDKVIRKLQRMEQSVFKDIEKDIFALFGRYATENNLTYEEAIRLLTSDEYRDFKMDVGSYIKTINNESVDEKAREKLELEYNTLAMKTRTSRLEELTYRVNKNLDTLFFVTHRAVKELLEKSVTKSYNSAHTLKRDPSLRDKKLYKILEQPWSGANYSANIWNNRDKLAGIAQNEITKGIYQGKSAKKISKNISERLDASMKDIERVVRTESKHARNEASAQAYIDMGYEWYMFSSHTEGKSSNRTCERCRKINEEKYRFDKRVVGENFPPLHPNCRCTIIPIMNDEMVEKSRKEEYTEIEIDLDDEKYRAFDGSYEIDEKSNIDVVQDGQVIIEAKKVKNNTPLKVYKSNNVKEISKISMNCLNYFLGAIDKLGLKIEEIPEIYICEGEIFSKDLEVVYASYNIRNNILRINNDVKYSKIERAIKREYFKHKEPNEPFSRKEKSQIKKLAKIDMKITCIHELVHWLDVKKYKESHNVKEMTKDEYYAWLNWSRDEVRKNFAKNDIEDDEILKIGGYAASKLEEGKLEEVIAEYIAQKMFEFDIKKILKLDTINIKKVDIKKLLEG